MLVAPRTPCNNACDELEMQPLSPSLQTQISALHRLQLAGSPLQISKSNVQTGDSKFATSTTPNSPSVNIRLLLGRHGEIGATVPLC